MDWPVLLRPLPRFIAPFRDETINSYLARLATANRLAPAALRVLLASGNRNDAPVPLIRLAAVTGMPRAALAHAMPQICTADELADLRIATPAPRPRRVVVRHLPALHRGPPGDPVGAARRRRLRPPPPLDQQRPGTAGPDRPAGDPHRTPPPPAANPRHGRDTVMRAFRDARHICLGWRLDGIPDDGYGRRMEIFHGPGWRDRDDDENQTSDAASYPQAVALTRLLASPYWRERSSANGARPEEFETELRRTVAPGYIWRSTRAPAGAATGTTRCSNGGISPATRNPNHSHPGVPGHAPKPSRPAVTILYLDHAQTAT